MTLSGGLRQITRSHTLGQQVETAVQLGCGLLSVLSLLTCFRWRRWAPPVRAAWVISLAAAAGLSSLVWGPPLLIVALAFAAGALLLALGILRLLRIGLAEDEVAMIQAGFTMVSPLTQSRTVVIATDAETGGAGFTLEVTCLPGMGPNVMEHLHEAWTETFEILSGRAQYRLGGKHLKAEAGETIVMPPPVPHVHPWNAGAGEMTYRQTSRFETPSRQAVQDTLGSFATMNGLAREGKVDARGLPRNPLQLAAILRTLGRHGGYSTRLPIPAQKLLSATLGRFAEALGYRGVYERYVRGESAR
jgi:quercetin dioxygenase-like cupin family protein